jgi:hypothetical protein
MLLATVKNKYPVVCFSSMSNFQSYLQKVKFCFSDKSLIYSHFNEICILNEKFKQILNLSFEFVVMDMSLSSDKQYLAVLLLNNSLIIYKNFKVFITSPLDSTYRNISFVRGNGKDESLVLFGDLSIDIFDYHRAQSKCFSITINSDLAVAIHSEIITKSKYVKLDDLSVSDLSFGVYERNFDAVINISGNKRNIFMLTNTHEILIFSHHVLRHIINLKLDENFMSIDANDHFLVVASSSGIINYFSTEDTPSLLDTFILTGIKNLFQVKLKNPLTADLICLCQENLLIFNGIGKKRTLVHFEMFFTMNVAKLPIWALDHLGLNHLKSIKKETITKRTPESTPLVKMNTKARSQRIIKTSKSCKVCQYDIGVHNNTEEWKFCPICGARM